MLALMVLSSIAALLFVYIFMPALWLSIIAVDESLDAHEAGLAMVASRMSSFSYTPFPYLIFLSGNPFRESGPPANMAKLILLRHKVRISCCAHLTYSLDNDVPCQIQTTNRKRRSSSHTRQVSRITPARPKTSWMRFGRPFGGKQYH